MVRDEVEDEAQPTLAEHGTRGGKSPQSAEVLIDDVAAHAVGRADVVLRDKVGERSPVFFEEPRAAHRDHDPSRAALPDDHDHTASKPPAAMRSHSSVGTVPRFSVRWYFLLRSPSQAHVLIS